MNSSIKVYIVLSALTIVMCIPPRNYYASLTPSPHGECHAEVPNGELLARYLFTYVQQRMKHDIATFRTCVESEHCWQVFYQGREIVVERQFKNNERHLLQQQFGTYGREARRSTFICTIKVQLFNHSL